MSDDFRVRAFVCSQCDRIHLKVTDPDDTSIEVHITDDQAELLIADLLSALASQRSGDPQGGVISNCEGSA